MKRKELFEFEDFSWLPDTIRNGVTNLISVFHKLMGSTEIVSELIIKAQTKYPFSQIVDLGSGAGGPMLYVIKALNKTGAELNLQLSDIQPNQKIVEKINREGIPNVSYIENAIDAVNIAQAPEGLKTMMACFHHMPPSTASKILNAAQENKQAILIYEVAENTIPFLVWLLFLPISLIILFIMVLFMTPLVRPLSISQILFTYLIPIIPLVYAWDGQTSLMRTYTFKDIEELIKNKDAQNYHWEINQTKNTKGKKVGYYIMGYPV